MRFVSDYSHSKKHFEKISKPNITCPDIIGDCEIETPAISPFSELNRVSSLTKNIHHSKLKRKSNIVDIVIQTDNLKPIFLIIFQSLLLPNLLAFLIIVLLIKFEEAVGIYCSNENESAPIYNEIRNILTYDMFYIVGIYLCLFEERLGTKFTWFGALIFAGSFLIILFVNHYKLIRINGQEIYADIFFFPLIFQIGTFIIISKRAGRFGSKEYKKILFVCILFFMGGLDQIILKRFLIDELNQQSKGFQHRKLFLQCFLFIFYQVYGKMFLGFLQKFKGVVLQNLFLYTTKVYIANAICSCVALPLTRKNGALIDIFSFLNFSVQLFSLYKQKNFVISTLRSAFAFLLYFFRMDKKKCNVDSKKADQKLSSTIAGSTNGVIYYLIFVVLSILVTKKTFRYPQYDLNTNNNGKYCKKEVLVKNINIGPENLCFLFLINFFFFLYLILKMKDKKKSKFLWKTEQYHIFIKILYYILFYAFVDTGLQFYLYLDLIIE